MSLPDVIRRLGTGTYTVTRAEAGTYDPNGRALDGVTSQFTIEASVQPLAGSTLSAAPEGFSSSEMQVLYTPTILLTVCAQNQADVVAIDGLLWVVVKASRWKAFGQEFCVAYVARQGGP